MGKLITVVGNSGVGKTTLARRLCYLGNYIACMEGHEDRPFQKMFSTNRRRYAFHNQIDYFLYRAEQELTIRDAHRHGIQDGGLDQDYYVFTRHFYDKGYLNSDEFAVCQRTFRFFRRILQPPDLIIWLKAPIKEIEKRFMSRNRDLEIAKMPDLSAIEILVDSWLSQEFHIPIIQIDASDYDKTYSQVCDELITRIDQL